MTFFMLMFCFSGIVLNHRTLFAELNLSRSLLPEKYHYKKWDNGLLRGAVTYRPDSAAPAVLLYGTGGVWVTDKQGKSPADFNQGLPEPADYRQIKGLAQLPDGSLFAAAQFGLYRHDGKAWQPVTLPQLDGEKLTDLTVKGDTLAVLSRSALYTSLPPYRTFERQMFAAPEGYTGKVSLFRTVWMLHCGEMFGLAGKLLMDGVALVLCFLCVTGFLFWLLPHYIRRKAKQGIKTPRSKRWLGVILKKHDQTGRYAIAILLFVAFTGWCLRPPLLIVIAQGEVPALPGSSLNSPNAWNDKLRMIRYDKTAHDWLLSTSEGFYRLTELDDVPEKLDNAPDISVMGQNVWEKDREGRWICGSFSGMFAWDRTHNTVTDWFTGKTAAHCHGAPFGKEAISGYCAQLDGKPFAVDYDKGTDALHMPETMRYLPMSLWNLCLEIHTGRIYTVFGKGTLFFITFAGLFALWCLWSGFKVRLPRKKKA